MRMFARPNGSGKSVLKVDLIPAWFKRAVLDKLPARQNARTAYA